MLEFGIPIPYEQIEDENFMKKLRSMFRFNPDIPGAIELVHPNKFLPSKQWFLNIFQIWDQLKISDTRL